MTTMVVCPSCGTEAHLEGVTRSADEFCRKCDYPLFWAPAPTTIASLEEDGTAEATLRRLPGSSGRRAVASVPCPTCSELNAPTSLVCIRCGGPMVLAEPDPEPEPEPEPDPEPELVPIPDERSNLLWWIALGVGLVLVTVLVIALAA